MKCRCQRFFRVTMPTRSFLAPMGLYWSPSEASLRAFLVPVASACVAAINFAAAGMEDSFSMRSQSVTILTMKSLLKSGRSWRATSFARYSVTYSRWEGAREQCMFVARRRISRYAGSPYYGGAASNLKGRGGCSRTSRYVGEGLPLAISRP